MIKYISVVMIFLFFGSYSNSSFAQKKFEKENCLKQNDVPLNPLNFIDSLSFNDKVKWYLEEGLEKKSIEAKFKRNGKNTS
ncbi:hypothetical protein [Aequorivita antarctica]|uniref:Uncharacterized protein n=1 Tax=Aequorivita antarctica TaxID=153266 RepID=A0A5C6YXI8_9FLAO|nr:hypothetical protein [Aequorivita antarctica]TXD71811.1 hypothetical protein ESU54_15430 [Aequorivita antarctica]SRX75489.1 hypothetical protein AEQU3_02484 [Aequorivita antarctica]